MVTDKERDYLWNVYAADKRMRLNLGIRRRLAPLLENDLRKIQLMNSLLLSMPGTPIVYYGDEIGMGDNIFLGDRDGVRTPMQWSPDRNGGFSRADPARLFLPPIMDAIYGYEAVNVESQQRDPSSLLNWMKRMIAVRQAHQAFGRGTLRLLYPRNRKILAYLREHEGDRILCVANLSRSAQAVELNLAEFRGFVPVELLGRSPFPPIGDLPYLLTLPGHGFFWFVLAEEAELPRWHEPIPEPLPDFITLVIKEGGWRTLFDGNNIREFTREVLPEFLAKQRWFAGKDLAIGSTRVVAWAELPAGRESYLLAELEVELGGGSPPQRYFLPLATSYDDQALTHGWPLLSFSLAQVRRGAKVGALYDAMAGGDFPLAALEAIRTQSGAHGLRGHDPLLVDLGRREPLAARAGRDQALRRRAEQLDDDDRQPRGLQGLPQARARRAARDRDRPLPASRRRALPTRRRCSARSSGSAADGETTALAAAFGFVRNQGDGWVYTIEYLHRTLDELRLHPAPAPDTPPVPPEDHYGLYLAQARVLGQRTAELHRALRDADRGPGLRRRADRQGRPRGLAESRARARPRRPSRRCARPCRGSPRTIARRAQALLDRRERLLRPHRGADQGPGRRGQDPRARRLPPRPGAGRAERLLHPRLRGRARAPARRAPRQVLAAQGRRRHAALVRLRRVRRGDELRRARPGQRARWCAGSPRAGARRRSARSSPPIARPSATARAIRRTPPRRSACSTSSCSRRRSTRSATKPPTARHWVRIPLKGVTSLLELEATDDHQD